MTHETEFEFEDEDEGYKIFTCSNCSGSGEGPADRTTCRECKGSGQIILSTYKQEDGYDDGDNED